MAFERLSRYAGYGKSAWRSNIGKDFRRGVGEMAGFHYQKDAAGILRNTGFLGRKMSGMGMKPLGMFGKAMTGLGLIWGITDAVDAYREEGAWGAAKSGAGSLAMGGAFRVATGIAGRALSGLGPVGVAAAAVYGTYQLGEAAKVHVKRLRGLEMGRDIPDRFGTISTIRQRSLQAIQNTHINGRLAIGNEAMIRSRGF
jgi:hypothetical protein